MLALILGNLLFFAGIIIVFLVYRGFNQMEALDEVQKASLTYQQNISGKFIEFRENLATIVGSGLYDDDEYLNLLMKHANYMIEFLEGLERGIKIEFLDEVIEKPNTKGISPVRTVAHFTSDDDENE